MNLTPDEVRVIELTRTAQAMAARPQGIPPISQVSDEEWSLIMQRRLAQQTRVAGSGIATSHPDPFKEQASVAIFVLMELLAYLKGDNTDHGNVTRRWVNDKLATLGADVQTTPEPDKVN